MFEIDYLDKKPLGNTGEYISAIGIGTWDIRNYKMAEEAIIYAVESGINVVDTAEMYHAGLAEELVGKVIKRVGRDNVFITTKLLPHNFTSYDFVYKAMKNSLSRLGVSVVDLTLVHWPEANIPIWKYINYLENLANQGLTRYIGVSNFDIYDLKAALNSVKKYDIVVNQVKYSVLDKKIEGDFLKFMINNKITIQAYTPLERGRVAHDYRIIDIAKKYGKTPVQVSLNYLISHKMVTAIPKTEKKERVDEFLGALGWRLNIEDITYLSKI